MPRYMQFQPHYQYDLKTFENDNGLERCLVDLSPRSCFRIQSNVLNHYILKSSTVIDGQHT